MQRPLNPILLVALLVLPLLHATAYGKNAGKSAAEPVITPQSIVFPCTPAGDSSFRIFTITSTDDQPRVITGFGPGLPPAFRLPRIRRDTIRRGRPYIDTIWFMPRDSGLFRGTFEVRFNRGSAYAAVEGPASAKAILIFNHGVDSLRFATNPEAGSSENYVRIVNPSCKPLGVEDILITGNGTFRLSPPITFPLKVLPGKFVDVGIEFRPPAVGEFIDTVTFVHAGRRAQVKLLGRNAPSPLAVIPLQIRLIFDSTYLGDTVTRVLRLRNNGPRPDTLRSWTLFGINPDQFSLDPSAFPLALRANNADTASLLVRFVPSRIDTQRARLQLRRHPGDDEAVEVGLLGTGMLPDVQVEPLLLDIGDVPVLGMREIADTIVIRNFSTQPIHYSPLKIVGPDSLAYTLTGPTSNTSVPANDSVRYGIRFTPHRQGLHTARILVPFGDRREHRIGLVGRGTLPAEGDVTVLPDSIGFPCIPIGDTSDIQYITVANPSAVDVTIEGIALVPRTAAFIVPETVRNTVIAHGMQEKIPIRFSPDLPGTTGTTLYLRFRGGLVIQVKLHGDATVRPEADLDRNAVDFGLTYLGSTTRDTITLTNLSACKNLIIDSVTLTDTSFDVEGVSGPFGIAGADQYRLAIAYTPRGTGTHSGELRIMSENGTRTVQLAGEGIRPFLRPLPDELRFAETVANTISDWDTITIVNDGNTADTLLGTWSVEGETEDIFEVVMPSTPTPVRPAIDSIRIAVRFHPEEARKHGGTLRIEHRSGTHTGQIAIALTGDAVAAPGPHTLLIDAGAVRLGDTVQLADTLVLLNPTSTPLAVTAEPVPGGTNATSFSLTPPATNTIPAQGSLAYGLRFVPGALGTHEAHADITLSNGLTARVNFTGRGTSRAPRKITLDTLTSDVNKRFTINVTADPPFDVRDNVTHLRLKLRYRRTALFLHGVERVDGAVDSVKLQDTDIVEIERTFRSPVTSERLIALSMQGLITGSPANVVEIVEAEVNGLGAVGTLAPGLVYLNGCEIAHPVSLSRPVAIHGLYPSPAGTSVTLRYFAADGSQPVARLVNTTGAAIAEYQLPTGKGAETETTLDLRGIGSGAYFLELRTLTVRTIAPVMISQ